VREAVSDSTTSEFAFLSLFTTSGQSLPSLVSFVVFLAPLLGVALGFDALNSERSQRTLSRLMSQPIHRDAVLHGKFLAGLGVVRLALTALVVIVGGVGIVLLGRPPSAEEVGRSVSLDVPVEGRRCFLPVWPVGPAMRGTVIPSTPI
jgi:ABC-2 type transport system permease protein